MEDHSLLVTLAGIVSALGLKEIWNIVKKRMDIKASKEERVDGLSLKVIQELKEKITALELKIDVLITEKPEFYIQTFLHYVKANGEYADFENDTSVHP